MKRLLVVIFIFFITENLHSQPQWQIVRQGNGILVSGCFLSPMVGLVISSNGAILRTADSGFNWSLVTTLAGDYFHTVCPAGGDTVYACGNQIYRSCNGGLRWQLVRGIGDIFSDMIFFGSRNGFAIVPNQRLCNDYTYVDTYKVAKTIDSGVNWQYFDYIGQSESYFQKINDSVAFLFGGSYDVYPECYAGWWDYSQKTLNKGATWITAHLDDPNACYSMVSPDTGYRVAPGYYNTKIWITRDGTNSVTEEYTEINDPSVTQCLFINHIDGYLKGSSIVKVTHSGGLVWENDLNSSQHFNKLFRSAGFLFAITAEGTIYRKQIVESLNPDTVYRLTPNKTALNFNYTAIDSTVIKPLKIINTGNSNLVLTITSTDPFSISFSSGNYTNMLVAELNPSQDTTINVRFHPTQEGNYHDTILITGPHINQVFVHVSGVGFRGLSGVINKDTLICRPEVVIVGDITVKEGITMTICAGTHVTFMNDFSINVEGALNALGDSAANIVFKSYYSPGKWHGINVNNSSSSVASNLRWCKLEERCTRNASLFISKGKVIADHCSFINPVYSGCISVNPGGILILKNSRVTNSGFLSNYPAIYCNNCDTISICNNEISTNKFPMKCITNGFIEIRDNNIHDNTDRGINISSSGSAIISGNKVYKNGGGMIVSGTNLRIEKNEVFFNSDNSDFHVSGVDLRLNGGLCILQQNLIYNNYSQTRWAGGGIFAYSSPGNGINTSSDGSEQFQGLTGLIGTSNLHLPDAMSTLIMTGNNLCNNSLSGGYGLGNEFYAKTEMNQEAFNVIAYNNIIFNCENTKNNVYWENNVQSDFEYNLIRQESFPGAHNIYGNPEFVNPTTVIGLPSATGHFDWSLNNTSPCINKGDSIHGLVELPTDFAGNPRIFNKIIDIGAYELQDTAHNPGAIKENLRKHQCFVFPNPAYGFATIIVNFDEACEIKLFDLFGRLIHMETFLRKTTIDLTPLPGGPCFYQIGTDKQVFGRGKLIIRPK